MILIVLECFLIDVRIFNPVSYGEEIENLRFYMKQG